MQSQDASNQALPSPVSSLEGSLALVLSPHRTCQQTLSEPCCSRHRGNLCMKVPLVPAAPAVQCWCLAGRLLPPHFCIARRR